MRLMNIKTKDWLRQNWLLLAWFYPLGYILFTNLHDLHKPKVGACY